MNPFEFVIVLVIAVLIFRAWQTKHQSSLPNAEGQDRAIAGQREAELQREIEDLRERVKVLERIATDGHETRLLSDEIEKLRDR